MDVVTPDATLLGRAVNARYDALACCATTLSCGAALDLGEPRPGEVVIDLGCGRGKDVIRAAGLVGAAGRALGVDASDEMLAAARRSCPPFLANARFVRSDLAEVALPSGEADLVLSNCAINHAPDKAAVYREIHRLLRAGGRFVVSDVVSEAPLPEEVRSDPAAWAACYGGSIPESDYLESIRAAGFGDPLVLSRTAPYEKGGVLVHSLTVKGIKP